MHRYFAKISFEGTAYNGWQLQKNTSKTVQQVINESLSGILNEPIEVTGCGRTDTGVHAKMFYLHFDSRKNDLHLDPRVWMYKFNKVLPKDVAVEKIIPVHNDAHARFDAIERTYEYFITTKKNPFLINRAYYLYGIPDVEIMNQAGKILCTYTDFSSFSKSNTQVKTNNCKVMRANWEVKNDLLVFTITSDRFLRNMVRAIVGTMLELGQEKISLQNFQNIIKGKNRSDAGFSVPASGLYLTDIKYPSKIFINE